MVATVIAGMGAGLITPPQGAAVADVIGSKAKGGPVLASYQMAADIGAIIGPVATGVLAEHLSYTAAFVLTGGISLLAALAWLAARETLPRRDDSAPAQEEHTAADLVAECRCLDEGPEVPTGQSRHRDL